MRDLLAKKPYVDIQEVKDLEKDNENCIRVYCSQAPDVFTFQIRTFKPITGMWGKGKPRNMIATAHLTLTELEEILEYCKQEYPEMKRINTSPLERF